MQSRTYLPLSKPALIGAGLILFVFQWQAYLWPLLIAPDPGMKVAPVAIAQFAGEHGVASVPSSRGRSSPR